MELSYLNFVLNWLYFLFIRFSDLDLIDHKIYSEVSFVSVIRLTYLNYNCENHMKNFRANEQN